MLKVLKRKICYCQIYQLLLLIASFCGFGLVVSFYKVSTAFAFSVFRTDMMIALCGIAIVLLFLEIPRICPMSSQILSNAKRLPAPQQIE